MLTERNTKDTPHVVRIAAPGFELNGRVFDAEVRRDPDLDQLQELKSYVCVFRR